MECTAPAKGADKATCTKCATTSPFILFDNQCQLCEKWVTDCEQCDASGTTVTCKRCRPTYFLEDSSCKLCSERVSHCRICDNDGMVWGLVPVGELEAVQCQECDREYYVDSGNCKICSELIPNCLTCDDTTKPICTNCEEGYVVSVNETMCEKCDSYMAECATCARVEEKVVC